MERADLRSLTDSEVFAAVQTEKRAVATENVCDFIRLADEADQRRRAHYGLIFVNAKRFQRRDKRTVGKLVTALGAFLDTEVGDDARSFRAWL